MQNQKPILQIEGYCSIDSADPNRISVTCKTDRDEYKRHFLGRSDNVTYFAEQIESSNVSASHYKVVFKPSVVVPEVEVR